MVQGSVWLVVSLAPLTPDAETPCVGGGSGINSLDLAGAMVRGEQRVCPHLTL